MMKEYALAALAGVWVADGILLLLAPRLVMNRIRELTSANIEIFRWQIATVAAGLGLLFLGWDLPHQPLWTFTALAMIAKGLFLWLGVGGVRDRIVAWCVTREEVDYRFWGLGLCALAVLLLHALGWIGNDVEN